MYHDLSIVTRLAADRQHASRSVAVADQPGGFRLAPRSARTPLERSFGTYRRRRPARGRRWPS
jgi:hypothetical protein